MTIRGLMLSRALRDAVAGVVIFGCGLTLLSGVDGWSVGRAVAADVTAGGVSAATLALVHDADGAGLAALLQARDVAGQAARIVLLGLTFATMFAFNMAFARHLRRVYASPRRNGWRRGRRPDLTGS